MADLLRTRNLLTLCGAPALASLSLLVAGCGDEQPSRQAAAPTPVLTSANEWTRAPIANYVPGSGGGISYLTIGIRMEHELDRERGGGGAPLAYASLDEEPAQKVLTIGRAGASACYAVQFNDDVAKRLFPWRADRVYVFAQNISGGAPRTAALKATTRPSTDAFDQTWLARRLGCAPVS